MLNNQAILRFSEKDILIGLQPKYINLALNCFDN